jgi:hypothetical protein
MPNHEYFRELSALAAIGQLSAEEDRELGQHLIDCGTCREASAEYAHVVQHQLPQADPIRWRVKSLMPKASPDADVRDRFVARARAEGVEFSVEVEEACHPEKPGYPSASLRAGWGLVTGDSKRTAWRLSFATAAIAVIAVMGATIYRLETKQTVPATNAGTEAGLLQENQSLHAQLASLQQSMEVQSAALAAAGKEKSVSGETLEQLERQLDEARATSDALTARLQQVQSKETEFEAQNQQKDAQVANLRAQNEREHRENASNLSTVIIQEGRIRELTESLQQQAAGFEQERELMAASKDVRQLMGARNLHIMDVHDTDGTGKSARAFGRVFYAEGQSLVFYAFDLPSGRLTPTKYTFQAWGQRESVSHSVRNLGTFAIDDHEQHRWVLKVNDPKLLKGIDSVFVTAEALGDAGEPRGKKILYAFIVGEPNHP